MPDYCPICARENRKVKLDEIGWSERNRLGGRERVFHCSRCGNEATLAGLKMLATQAVAPRRVRTAEPEPAMPQPSKEEYHRIALYHFDRGDRQRAFDFFRLAGYDNGQIENAIFNHLKNKGYDRGHIERVMEQELGHVPNYKWQSDIPESQRGQKREGSDGYLSARAYLQIGKGKPMEVNAEIEEPKYLPEILVNKPIPFDNLPVPPGRYQLLAKFESPEYGLLKARYPAVDSGQEYFTIQTGQRLAVNFIFRITAAARGGGGRGRPININLSSSSQTQATATATAIARGGGGGGGGGGARRRRPHYEATVRVTVTNQENLPIGHVFVQLQSIHPPPALPPPGAPVPPPMILNGETDGHGQFIFDHVPASLVPMPDGTPASNYRINARVFYFDDYDNQHDAVGHVDVTFRAGDERKEVSISLEVPSKYLERTANPGNANAPPIPPLPIENRFHKDWADRWDVDQGSGRTMRTPRPGIVGAMEQNPLFGGLTRYSKRAGKTGGIIMSLVMITLGIVFAAITGIWQFIIGLAALGGYIAVPAPPAWERDMGRMWDPGNRWKAGQAGAKATFKVAFLIFIGWALWDFSRTSFPLAPLIFIGFAFMSYFSLPGSYNPEQPYEIMSGIIRLAIGGFVIPVMIFIMMFQSWTLAWLAWAFFFVVPTPTRTKNLAQILGQGFSGVTQTAEMLDKMIFVVLMVIGLIAATGTILIPLPFFQVWAGQWGLTGSSLYVFYAVWFISAVAGFFSPPETRPYTGILMITTALVLFGLGPGSQTLGGALFGEWWPTIHNTVVDVMKPVGEAFGQLQSTFGQSWLLLSCPTCYARQITEGNFVGDEISKAGAFGLEIDKFQIQSIYPEEPFTFSINLANKGTFKAKNIRLELITTIPGIDLKYNNKDLMRVQKQISIDTPESFFGKTMTFTSGYGTIYVYTINVGEIADIERQDVKDLLIIGTLPCPVNDKELSATREKYIPFVANLTYTYESESTLQIDFISEEEWKRLSVENTLVRGQVPSKISSAPAKLNLGTADQPIKEGNAFNVGFNLSSAEGSQSAVGYATVTLSLPKAFGDVQSNCQKVKTVKIEGDYNIVDFDLSTPSKASFCFYPSGVSDIRVPKKTYTLSAKAEYVFSRWGEKDTLINFRDICWTKYLLAHPENANSTQ